MSYVISIKISDTANIIRRYLMHCFHKNWNMRCDLRYIWNSIFQPIARKNYSICSKIPKSIILACTRWWDITKSLQIFSGVIKSLALFLPVSGCLWSCVNIHDSESLRQSSQHEQTELFLTRVVHKQNAHLTSRADMSLLLS